MNIPICQLSENYNINHINTITKIIMNIMGTIIPPVDRFNLLQHNIYQHDALPIITNASLEDICQNRVNELYNIAQSKNKKIVQFFSSGIDSLCILANFILANKHNKLIIYESPNNETNVLIQNLIKEYNIQYINCPFDELDKSILDNNITISGNPADQLFHSAYFYQNNQRKEVIKQNFKNNYNELQTYFSKCPLELNENCIDRIFWWLSYSLKWNETSYQHTYIALKRLNYILDFNNYYAFFNTIDFSNWAFTYNYTKTQFGEMGLNYKLPFKNIIYKIITNNELKEFVMHKSKVFSRFYDYNIVNKYRQENNSKLIEILCKDENNIYNIIKINGIT